MGKKERKLCVITLMMKKKDYLKKEYNKRKSERRDNLDDDGKEQLRKYEKKRKESYA